ncbi:MAG: DUF6113 family protein [Nocardioidaceae bacterium]
MRLSRSTLGFVAVIAALVLVGVAAGVTGALVHREAWRDGGLTIPWGVVLALVTAFACVYAGGTLLGGLGGPFAVAGGWVVSVLYITNGRPEGDFLIAQDAFGNAFAWGGVAVVGGAVIASSLTQTAGRLRRQRERDPRLGP